MRLIRPRKRSKASAANAKSHHKAVKHSTKKTGHAISHSASNSTASGKPKSKSKPKVIKKVMKKKIAKGASVNATKIATTKPVTSAPMLAATKLTTQRPRKIKVTRRKKKPTHTSPTVAQSGQQPSSSSREPISSAAPAIVETGPAATSIPASTTSTPPPATTPPNLQQPILPAQQASTTAPNLPVSSPISHSVNNSVNNMVNSEHSPTIAQAPAIQQAPSISQSNETSSNIVPTTSAPSNVDASRLDYPLPPVDSTPEFSSPAPNIQAQATSQSATVAQSSPLPPEPLENLIPTKKPRLCCLLNQPPTDLQSQAPMQTTEQHNSGETILNPALDTTPCPSIATPLSESALAPIPSSVAPNTPNKPLDPLGRQPTSFATKRATTSTTMRPQIVMLTEPPVAVQNIINRADSTGIVSATTVEDTGLAPPPLTREVVEWLSKGRINDNSRILDIRNELQRSRNDLLSIRHDSLSKQIELANRLGNSMIERDLANNDRDDARVESDLTRNHQDLEHKKMLHRLADLRQMLDNFGRK